MNVSKEIQWKQKKRKTTVSYVSSGFWAEDVQSEYALYVSRTIVLKKSFVGTFFHFSRTLSGKLSAFELTFPKHALNEGLWTYSKKYNESKKKWGKLRVYTFFGVYQRKIFALRTKSLTQCFKNCVLRTRRKVSEEIVFHIIWLHTSIRPSSGKISYFEWKHLAYFSKQHPTFIEAF